tara:strand:+ start:893 stop:1450 length:558 start_codon:yes stop_codon:yes gene_type:complete
MKLTFITTNPKKVEEAKAILKPFNIEIEQKSIDYPEDKEGTIQELVIKAIQPLAEQLQQPIIIEDTGLFFEAYNNFPGLFPKFIYQTLGFEGIQKLLEGKSRKASFKAVVGYCEPGKELILFEGEMPGTIIEGEHTPRNEHFPYDTIFLAEGQDKINEDLPDEVKNAISHRCHAFKKLGKHLSNL